MRFALHRRDFSIYLDCLFDIGRRRQMTGLLTGYSGLRLFHPSFCLLHEHLGSARLVPKIFVPFPRGLAIGPESEQLAAISKGLSQVSELFGYGGAMRPTQP